MNKTNTQPVGVEEMTSEKLAVIFHDVYEMLAPFYGYETRKETREFDPESNNGKLMRACCHFIIKTEINPLLSQAKREGAEEAYMVLDDIDSLPDMIHPTTGEDYKKLWRMIQKRIDAFKALSAPNTEK